MCNFDPKIWISGAKSNFFCHGITIFVNRAYHQYTIGYNIPIGITPKKISVSEVWVFFQGSPRFLAILSNAQSLVQVPLILDHDQRNLVGPSGP